MSCVRVRSKYWVFFIRDVTEEKRKELDLLRFSNVIHNTINPIQITDANGMMVYVNPAFEKVSGYSRQELIGKNPKILRSGKHSKEFWSEVWKHIISGKVWVGRIENRRKDGSPFFTELVISPIVDSHGTDRRVSWCTSGYHGTNYSRTAACSFTANGKYRHACGWYCPRSRQSA